MDNKFSQITQCWYYHLQIYYHTVIIDPWDDFAVVNALLLASICRLQTNPNAANINVIADLYAEVIGVLAASRYKQLQKKTNADVNVKNSLMALTDFRYMHNFGAF